MSDKEDVDLRLFLQAGEGYASWYYKIQKFFGDRHLIHFPKIILNRAENGLLSLENKEVINEISRQSKIKVKLVSQMLNVDIEALQPYSDLLNLEINGFDRVLELPHRVNRFCVSCFECSLTRTQIPIFNPVHSTYLATHCLLHRTPLVPISILSEMDMSHGSSQFSFWHDTVRKIRTEFTQPMRHISGFTYGFPSTCLLDVNRLFQSEVKAKEVPTNYDNKNSVEALRQKFLGVYFLLWVRRGTFTIGEELCSSMNITEGRIRFPSFNVFSSKNLEIANPLARSICLEVIGMFLINLNTHMPIHMRRIYMSTKSTIIKRTSNTLGALENNPLVILAWECFNNEEDYCLSEIKHMLPLFYEEWSNVVHELRGIIGLKKVT